MATTAFPVNPALTAIAIGYRNRDIDLIADRILPRIGKTGKKFKYTVYPISDAYTVPNTRVARRGAPTQVDFGGTEVPDECVDYGLDDVLPNDEVIAWEQMPKPASGGPVSPMAKSTSLLTGLILLDREIRVANLVFNAATYPAANRATLSGTSQWSDFVNSNPVDVILAALDVPIFRPNVLTFGQATWTKLRQHPRMVTAILGNQVNAGAVTREQVAAFFEVREVVVGAGFVNTARKGQAPVMSRVWGKHAAALFVSQDAADADQPTFGFTAEFGDRIAGDMNEPKLGLRGSTIVRVGESVKEVISAAASGYYFENAVA
jgi:hypothetical protein